MDVKMQSIDAIGLSVRSSNALHRAGVHTVGIFPRSAIWERSPWRRFLKR